MKSSLCAIAILFALTAPAAQAADAKVDPCREPPGAQAPAPGHGPVAVVLIQNDTAVPVVYRVRSWDTKLVSLKAGGCVRVPFPNEFEKLRSASVEAGLRQDAKDKCTQNVPVGYKLIVEDARERIKCRVVRHQPQ
jgi:hypothetical protein